MLAAVSEHQALRRERAVSQCISTRPVRTKHFDKERRGGVTPVCYKPIKGKAWAG